MSECTHDCSTCQENCGERQEQDLRAKLNPAASVKKVIAVVSGKGGVGKSLVTGLLASKMQSRGYQAAVLDADITGPSIPKSFGIHEHARGTEDMLIPCYSNKGTQIMSVNLILDNETDPVKKYGIKIYTTTDGQKIAEVTTKTSGGGVHFIFINERLDAGDTVIKAENDDAAYRNAKKFYTEKMEQDHYSECFTEWKNNTKIRMNDKYIDTYAKQFLGIA